MAQADPVVSVAELVFEQIGLRALTCRHLVISKEYEPQPFQQPPRAAGARSRAPVAQPTVFFIGRRVANLR